MSLFGLVCLLTAGTLAGVFTARAVLDQSLASVRTAGAVVLLLIIAVLLEVVELSEQPVVQMAQSVFGYFALGLGIIAWLIFDRRRRRHFAGLKKRNADLTDTLARRERQHAAVTDVVAGFVAAPTAGADVMAMAIKRVARELGVSRVGFWSWDARARTVSCDMLFDADDDDPPARFVWSARDVRSYVQAVSRAQVLAIDDARGDDRLAHVREAYVERHGIGATLDAPVRHSDILEGVLRCEHRGETRAWTSGEICFVSSMAHAMAVYFLLRDHAKRIDHVREAERAARRNATRNAYHLANVTGHVRTAMKGMMNTADTLALGPLGKDQREMVRLLRDAGAVSLSVLDESAQNSQGQDWGLIVEDEPFHLQDVARQIEAVYSANALDKRIDFSIDTRAAPTDQRLGSMRYVVQALGHVVSSAIQLTDNGWVKLTIASHPSEDDKIECVIANTSAGLRARAQKRHDDPACEVTDHDDITLRLANAKRLVTAMGGEFTVDNGPARGSAVRLVLALPSTGEPGVVDPDNTSTPPQCELAEQPGGAHPIDQDTPSPAPDEASTPHASGALAGLKVLVAEDNAVNRSVFRAMLEPKGVDLTFAEDGREAVKAFSDGAFDLVLMDIQMPVMDGVEALSLIRDLEKKRCSPAATPVIAVTANVMAHQVRRYEAVGFTSCVSKPIEPAQLFASMEQHRGLIYVDEDGAQLSGQG